MFNNFKVKDIKSFLKMINTKLKKQRYKQTDLANYLEIPASTLSDKLNGKTKFNADEVYKIANFLDRDLEYFYN